MDALHNFVSETVFNPKDFFEDMNFDDEEE
jgi:hypothetical protein